ncbi:hypothetical protein BCV69DRAFT_281964 [Microstroma glucosiphilum]|uniref:Uncharacterized protein n=1 Tax=Pseudomicrostroma glucosiphilum TaxID=1684307 RepID=A0A316UB25_9BASI|nr:hypothetical protein BCV69DRAFT_281964 [Pseudomicrostroma glucosiphilum]PWN22058.1 hypothetical protein BCV69DRAFT_281964 [Pseudomicrostroma glucosiphilum]
MLGIKALLNDLLHYAIVTLAFTSLAHVCGILSLLLALIVLPLIIIIDLTSFLFDLVAAEVIRAFKEANRYWGTDRLIKVVVGEVEECIQTIREAREQERVRLVTGKRLTSAAVCAAEEKRKTKKRGYLSTLAMSRHSPFRESVEVEEPIYRALSPRLAELPQELKEQIFSFLLHSTSRKGTYDITPLLLSSSLRDLYQPHIYNVVHLSNSFSFRKLRETLVLHNAHLGTLVKELTFASNQFDDTGYLADPLAPVSALSTGIEQLLLSMPNVSSLALDLYSLAALFEGDALRRLESGPRPTKLKIELTIPQYLDIPLYLEVEELEIVCFGIDENVARELRETLPRLKKLTMRLVRRAGRDGSVTSEMVSNGGVWDDDEDPWHEEQGIRLPYWSDSRTGAKDANEVIKAIELLRSWPGKERRSGTRLESLTVLSWGSATRELQKYFGYESPLQKKKKAASETVEPSGLRLSPLRLLEENSVVRFEEELDTLMELQRVKAKEEDVAPLPSIVSTTSCNDACSSSGSPATSYFTSGSTSPDGVEQAWKEASSPNRSLCPAPLRLDFDAYRHFGPRRGSVLAWTGAKPDFH